MATFKLSKKRNIEYVDVITVGVLAGVYRGGLKCELESGEGKRHFLTHLVFRRDHEIWMEAGCRQPLDNLADECLAGLHSRPTCPVCAKKYDKIKGGT
jgi:hypothetical protein